MPHRIMRIATETVIIIAIDYFLIASLGHNLFMRLALCVIADATVVLAGHYWKNIIGIPIMVLKGKRVCYDLTVNDFQARFAGSLLGTVWAFIQPVITISLYWFVFQVGLRASNVSEYPFVLYLMSGMIPWFYFSEAWSGGTNSLQEYAYLVKKVVFDVELLPVIKVSSSVFTHVFFVIILILFCVGYGYYPSVYYIQLPYYFFCMFFFVTGLVLITSACAAFFRDMLQIVNIALTIGIWIAPIMWNPAGTLPKVLVDVFRLNPIYYIVDGFRDSLFNKEWFWQEPLWTVYFWSVSMLTYIFGTKLFTKLKPHFSDVL